MIDGFFFQNIYIESIDVVFKNGVIKTPFFDIDINEYKIENKPLKKNIAYDDNLNEINIENVISKKNENKFYFYKIEEKKIFYKKYKSLFSNIQTSLEKFEEYSDNPIHSMIINELITNAYEHGSLNIDTDEKNNLLLNDKYLAYLKEREKQINSFFELSIFSFNNYLIVKIKDENKQFNILNSKEKICNGRGLKLIYKKSIKFFYSLVDNEFCVFLKRD